MDHTVPLVEETAEMLQLQEEENSCLDDSGLAEGGLECVVGEVAVWKLSAGVRVVAVAVEELAALLSSYLPPLPY